MGSFFLNKRIKGCWADVSGGGLVNRDWDDG